MISGQFAALQAERCLSTNDFSAGFMKQYDNALYQKIWKELSISNKINKFLHYPNLFSLVVNKAVKNKTLRNTITDAMTNLEARKKLQSPGFYFRVLFSK